MEAPKHVPALRQWKAGRRAAGGAPEQGKGPDVASGVYMLYERGMPWANGSRASVTM